MLLDLRSLYESAADGLGEFIGRFSLKRRRRPRPVAGSVDATIAIDLAASGRGTVAIGGSADAALEITSKGRAVTVHRRNDENVALLAAVAAYEEEIW
jgi:hypothetical protein